MKSWKLYGLLIAITLLGAAPVAAQNESALVQATKQKATDKKAKRVFTNDDYPEQPDAAASDSKEKQAGKADASKPTSDSKNDPQQKVDASAKGATEKEAKVAQLQRELDLSKKAEQELRDKLDKEAEQARTASTEFRRNMHYDAISNQQVTLAEFKKKQEELEKQISEAQSSDQKKPE